MNLHPILSFTDNVNSMIYCEDGIVKTQNYISYEQYLIQLGYTEKELHKGEIFPTILTKCCNGITF